MMEEEYQFSVEFWSWYYLECTPSDPLLELSGYPSQQSHLYSLRLVYEFLTVESLCATVIFVVVYEPLLSFRFRDPKALNMDRSDSVLRPFVASFRSKLQAFLGGF